MSFKSSLTEANPRQDTDVIPRQRNESIVPRQRTEVKEALSKLARTPPVDAKKGRPRMAGPSEFSVGPRVTDPSLEATLRPADQKNDRFTSERPSPSRRTPRALARFLIAALIGVAATLAWQHLGRPHSPPATNPSLGSEIAAESPPAAAASVPDASVSLAQTAQDFDRTALARHALPRSTATRNDGARSRRRTAKCRAAYRRSGADGPRPRQAGGGQAGNQSQNRSACAAACCCPSAQARADVAAGSTQPGDFSGTPQAGPRAIPSGQVTRSTDVPASPAMLEHCWFSSEIAPPVTRP